MVSLAKIDPDLDLPLDDQRYLAAYGRVFNAVDYDLDKADPAYKKAQRLYGRVRAERKRRAIENADARRRLQFERYSGPRIGNDNWMPPQDIVIPPDRLRTLDEASVLALMDSIREIGLHTPLTVALVENAEFNENDDASEPEHVVLVTGLHRLEACIRLGWDEVPTTGLEILHQAPDDRRLWEITENLHRAELTALERAEHLTEWKRLIAKKNGVAEPSEDAEPVHDEQVSKGGRGRTGGVSAAARALKVDRIQLHRAGKIDGIAPEAKQAARAAGIDDHQAALLAVASEPTPEAQLGAVAVQAARVKAPRKVKAPPALPTEPTTAAPSPPDPEPDTQPAAVPVVEPVAAPAAVPAEEDADAKLIRQLTWALEDGHRAVLQAAVDAINAGFTTARFFDESGRQWKPPANTNTPTDAAA